MSDHRVLCLGELLFDRLADNSAASIDEVNSWTSYPGGAPANVACGLVKLGTPATFIGCVGKDASGEALVKELQSVGVDVTGIQYHPTAPTREVYVLRSPTGDREFAGFGNLPPDCFADAFLQADRLIESLFLEAEYLVLGTLELAYPETRKAVNKALDLAHKYNLKILLDVNWRSMFWLDPLEATPLIRQVIKQVDFLKLSTEEAEWLFDTIDPGAIAYRLNSVEGVLVTAGENGCYYCISESEGHIPAFGVNVVDTTGAGDAFVAGFLHQLCQCGMKQLQKPETIKNLVVYASAVGALTTTKPGAIAAQPTVAEIDVFLLEQSQK
ncbi:carbohydrate kinase family protein [Merismopedia glauca]|uniref:Carbohydrate kinase n=1 Tax=Merismopedia glauca CCAP 1448/3 TaxID=1296344 RepID=A0A2T1C899_9CYAN|nr:carbohydrate kinase [Merismopedia glauca]PSB04490.1 carbohydrate kinase [Merismopedia glauca CCAP 1448/3]